MIYLQPSSHGHSFATTFASFPSTKSCLSTSQRCFFRCYRVETVAGYHRGPRRGRGPWIMVATDSSITIWRHIAINDVQSVNQTINPSITNWNILKYIEIYWNILKYIEIYWNILKYIESPLDFIKNQCWFDIDEILGDLPIINWLINFTNRNISRFI